jgi:F-type H+-transporting ATPase subunit b
MRKMKKESIVKSNKLRTVFYLSLCTFHLILFSAAAFAAEGREAQESLFKEYLWPVINFLVLLALLIYGFKKADIKGYFKKRTELIEQTLNEARQAKELAQKALAEVEDRLKMKDKEIEEIVASAKYSGEREKARLAEEGERMKEKIMEQARTNIEFELKRAKESIKEEAVEIAMELAEKKLKEKMTKEEQMKLLEESVAKIEGRK